MMRLPTQTLIDRVFATGPAHALPNLRTTLTTVIDSTTLSDRGISDHSLLALTVSALPARRVSPANQDSTDEPL
eukprot:3278068-Pyramimonas_sp.AAC.1